MGGVHIVYDLMHVYYKYLFMMKGGRMKALSSQLADGQVVPVSMIYYPLMDIEKNRIAMTRRFGCDVYMSFCLDSPPTERRELEGGEKYKANRVSKLTEEDRWYLSEIYRLLRLAGYAVYQQAGIEADDIVRTVVNETKSSVQATLVMTNDSDLAVNVDTGVHVMRYKAKHGYLEIGMGNYEQVLSDEFKCRIPYNAIMLFKSLCGDKADEISGVKGFGPKRFDGAISRLEQLGYDFKLLGLQSGVANAFEYLGLSSEEKEQALNSLTFVAPRTGLDFGPIWFGHSTEETRREAYLNTYGFKSLV